MLVVVLENDLFFKYILRICTKKIFSSELPWNPLRIQNVGVN